MNKKFIRTIALTLFICILFSTFAVANTGITVYKDTDSNYFKYVTGFSDNTFRPDVAVTRAEAAKMLSFVIDTSDFSNPTKRTFIDVNHEFWAYEAIEKLSSCGIINGYADGTFAPNEKITRAEFAAVLSRALNTLGEGKSVFKDISNHWAKEYITSLNKEGIVGGYPDNTFRPNANITRAEAVKIINRATGVHVNTAEKRNLFTDLPATHWAYYEVMAAASDTALETSTKHGNIAFEDIEYIDLDEDKIKNQFDTLLNEFTGATAVRQGEIFNEISKIESQVALSITMSNINSKRDVTSKQDAENLNNSYVCTNAILEAKNERYKLLESVKDTATFESVIGMKVEDIPEPEESVPEELIELFTKEQEYENDFNTFMYKNSITYKGKKYSLAQAEASSDLDLYRIALNYYVNHEQEYGEIFNNLVDVRTRIAHYFGYRYYTDVGYILSGKTHYTPEDVDALRADVKKYIAPLYYNILLAINGVDNGYLDFEPYIQNERHRAASVDGVMQYMKELSPQTRQTIEYMQKYGMFDTESRENKSEIAFTTYITEYQTPFVFMNQKGEDEDVETFAHEFGHAFQLFRIGENATTCSTDIAEVASYGMEMLTLHEYERFFGFDADKKILTNFFYKLQMILLTTFMDEFQYLVYKDPFLTIKERNGLYASLYNEYFMGATFPHDAYKKGICWTNPTHIFTMPYYSIDYTLAVTLAFQLWEIGENEGFDKEFETYVKLIESPYVSASIDLLARSAGMKSPFTSGIIESIAEKLDAIFKGDNLLSKAS